MSELDSLTGQAVFETERLSVRRWRRTEADGVFRIYSDPVGARWVDDGQPITMAESEAWLGVTATNYARRGYGMFAVDDRASGELLGYCGLVHPGGQVEAEVKYAFARSVWGRGFASEVVHGMVRHVSADLHTFEIAFFRNLFGLLAVSPLIVSVQLRAFIDVKRPE